MTHDPNTAACFTGHREIPKTALPTLRSSLYSAIENLYSFYGVRTFISGGAIGFDLLAAELVLQLKRTYADVRLVFALPCVDHTKRWNDFQITKFRMLSLLADEIIYVSQSYYNGCMHVRNKFMLQNSQFCISYCKKTSGGSYYTVSEAKKMNRTLIEL